MRYIKFIVLGLAVVSATACRKNTVSSLDIAGAGGFANMKIVHASAYAVNNSVQLKVNSIRVAGLLSYSTPFPGGGLNTGGSNMPWYMTVDKGPVVISLSLPKAGTNTDSVTLATKEVYANPDIYYTAYLTDTAANTQVVYVQENVAEPDDNTSRFKFVNLIPNQPSVDLYLNSIKIASAIAYKSFSPEFVLAKGGTAVWAIRPAGALPTSTALATYTQSGGIPNKRIMTVYSRGYAGQTTGNRVPAISLLYN
jgi:hypothetical protein